MVRYRLYVFAKWMKYGGFLSYILYLFSDRTLFSHLSLLSLFLVLELALSSSMFICTIKMLIGMAVVKHRYADNLPSPETFTGTVAYDFPFEGSWTVVSGGLDEQTSHAWNIPIERYAYDFLKQVNGCSHNGSEHNPESYYCYGKAILAPADGVVVKTKDCWPDSLMLGNGKFFNLAGHVAGNYILIKHAEGEFSLLAHLEKNSVLVKPGDRVQRLQQIAKCGNSGNSTEPHLHFQLQNGESFYTSVGLPLHFTTEG